jgi:hypothetical protein
MSIPHPAMFFDGPFAADSTGFASLNVFGRSIFLNVMSSRLQRCSPPQIFERIEVPREELIVEIRSIIDILVSRSLFYR